MKAKVVAIHKKCDKQTNQKQIKLYKTKVK